MSQPTRNLISTIEHAYMLDGEMWIYPYAPQHNNVIIIRDPKDPYQKLLPTPANITMLNNYASIMDTQPMPDQIESPSKLKQRKLLAKLEKQSAKQQQLIEQLEQIIGSHQNNKPVIPLSESNTQIVVSLKRRHSPNKKPKHKILHSEPDCASAYEEIIDVDEWITPIKTIKTATIKPILGFEEETANNQPKSHQKPDEQITPIKLKKKSKPIIRKKIKQVIDDGWLDEQVRKANKTKKPALERFTMKENIAKKEDNSINVTELLDVRNGNIYGWLTTVMQRIVDYMAFGINGLTKDLKNGAAGCSVFSIDLPLYIMEYIDIINMIHVDQLYQWKSGDKFTTTNEYVIALKHLTKVLGLKWVKKSTFDERLEFFSTSGKRDLFERLERDELTVILILQNENIVYHYELDPRTSIPPTQ